MRGICKPAIALLLAASIFACQKDDIEIDPPAGGLSLAQFGADVLLAENAGPKEVSILLNRAASREGVVTVKVNAALPGAFQTVPAAVDGELEIAVPKGAGSATFTITAADNALLDGNKAVGFELSSVSEGFGIGARRSVTVTILDDEAPVAANFALSSGSLAENKQGGLDVAIHFPAPAPAEGRVIVQASGLPEGEGLLSIEPAPNAGRQIELDVPFGATSVSFALYPVDDASANGNKAVAFTIVEAEGGVVKGTELSFDLTVIDDELAARAKSYESAGNGWRFKRTYEYDGAGRVSKVHWENETPFLTRGTDTYYYALSGLIERVNYSPGDDEYFYEENGRIVRSEKIVNGQRTAYSEYDYDEAGNVAGQADYHLQPTGEYSQSLVYAYLYFDGGDLYKQLTYIPAAGSGELLLISTRTYDGYSNIANPFPSVEIIPGISAQRHLPGTFRLEENGSDFLYFFSYEYREDGLPKRRTASGPAGTEVTVYEYY